MIVELIHNGLGESLKKEFQSEDIVECFKHIGVIKNNHVLFKYSDISPWQRGGAETYNAIGLIETNVETIKIIAKALVSFATRPEQQLKNWNSRRSKIIELGIPTPRLFSAFNGAIYEEFIDDEFKLDEFLDISILTQLGFIGAKLDKAGFKSISFIDDMRLKNRTLYFVDFGSDLGEPSEISSDNAKLYLVKKLTQQQYEIVKPIYDSIFIT